MSDQENGAVSPREQGQDLIRQGRFPEAVTTLRRVVEDSPSDEIAWRLLGVALNGSGERDGAVTAFEQAVALAPDSPKSHYNLAVALQGVGNLADARGHLEQAVALDPAYSQAKIALSALNANDPSQHPSLAAPLTPAEPATAAPPATPADQPPVPPAAPPVAAPAAELRNDTPALGQLGGIGGPTAPPAYAPPSPNQSYSPPVPGGPTYNAPGAYAPPPVLGIHNGPQENTSGMKGSVPAEIAGKWSWGGFGASWIWMLNHGMVALGIGLLIISFIPYLGWLVSVAASIYLGMKGNELGWKNRRFQSIEDFKACQKIWAIWGVILFVLGVIIGIRFAIGMAGMMGASNPTYRSPY